MLLGHQFDRGLKGGPQPRMANFGGSAERQRVFFETSFLVMGHLAKADGRVSEEEIRAARSVMHQMHLRPEQVRRAIDLFNDGKQPGFTVDDKVDRLARICRHQPQLIRTFLEIQFHVALAKEHLSANERAVLWRIAGRLGVSRVELAQLEAVLRAQRHFGNAGQQTARSGQQALSEAYRALGVSASASDKEVKTAYRRLMNEHHPDKLVARGLPDEMMEIAKEKTREIRGAYDLIKERRGMR
jgi:DnaJ like chaperone protein